MAKTKKRWIVGTNRQPAAPGGTFTELLSNPSDSVSAMVLPYDSTTSIYEAINQALVSTAGATGPQGSQGPTGAFGGPPGVTGLQGLQGATGVRGPSGTQGQTGLGDVGATGLQGPTGIQGETGFGVTGAIGVTGAYGGPQGTTGAQGATGLIGATGIQGLTGVDGATGIQGLGETGLQGETGCTGAQGDTGAQGFTGAIGPSGLTGAQGVQGNTGFDGITGTIGITGHQGITGFPGLGATGLQGPTGISAQTILFNPVSRYSVNDSSGEEVWVVSSAAVYNGVSWNRSGTTMTINRSAHGHSAGNQVIVRNTNLDYQAVTIDTTTANSFNITTTNTGASSGSGAYSMGFTFGDIGFPKTGGQVFAPTGDHPDCQLLAMRIRTGPRASTVYDLVVPASAINGAGNNTSLADSFIPDFNVRTDIDNLPAVAATIATNISGSYSTFEFGNLGLGSLSRIITVHF
jgi:hypothetical protein